MNERMIVYGDSISGNCMKIRFVADLLKIPHQWIETSVLKAETRTPEFLKLNPAGQVPVVVLPGGRPLAQSNAIILHLAEGSVLIPEDLYERALMLQWMFWEQYSHEPSIAVRRFLNAFLHTSDDEIDPTLKPRGDRALSVMDQHLSERDYFVGERISLADIALVAYTRWAHEGGFDLNDWPNVRSWVSRVEQAIGVSASS